MASIPHRITNRERTVLDLHPKKIAADSFELTTLDDTRRCPGCKLPAAGRKGGLVIACGGSFFHIDCYSCKKCRTPIALDDRVSLDLDGLLLCEDCLHKCNICNLSILELIIYGGNDSYYHPDCFRCKECNTPLDERRFGKTSRSIYCMECHGKRVIKIKKRLQRKTEREKRAYGGITSPKP
ncbi:hypothetical protein B0H34DRAFT_474613 [Crassisporium funariophilum]|nr:hypothetical protein B0H34DRAFT_474613 [Crassisporium funariophilum]